jgi:hypothetical protein
MDAPTDGLGTGVFEGKAAGVATELQPARRTTEAKMPAREEERKEITVKITVRSDC